MRREKIQPLILSRRGMEIVEETSELWVLNETEMPYRTKMDRKTESKGPFKINFQFWRERHRAICEARGGSRSAEPMIVMVPGAFNFAPNSADQSATCFPFLSSRRGIEP